jgi:hypothetical protein
MPQGRSGESPQIKVWDKQLSASSSGMVKISNKATSTTFKACSITSRCHTTLITTDEMQVGSRTNDRQINFYTR